MNFEEIIPEKISDQWDLVQGSTKIKNDLYIFSEKYTDFKDFIKRFKDIIWITYRSGFLPISKNQNKVKSTTLFQSITSKVNDLKVDLRNSVSKMSNALSIPRYDTDIFQEDSNIITENQKFSEPQQNCGSLTTDAGWGCMLRSSQMLLAEVLLKLGHDRNMTIKNFLEHHSTDQEEPVFSLHRMISIGKNYKKDPGSWYGPGTASFVLKDLINNEDSISLNDSKISSVRRTRISLNIVLAEQGTIYLEDFDQQNPETSFLEPILFLVPHRLGLNKINPKYYQDVFKFMKSPWSVGAIGGTPSHSLYFVGTFRSTELIYLDPHTTRTVSKKPDSTYICQDPRITDISSIDPSMSFGFLIKDSSEFKKFKKFIDTETKLIDISETRPSMDFEFDII
jgi:hypothetical protein